MLSDRLGWHFDRLSDRGGLCSRLGRHFGKLSDRGGLSDRLRLRDRDGDERIVKDK